MQSDHIRKEAQNEMIKGQKWAPLFNLWINKRKPTLTQSFFHSFFLFFLPKKEINEIKKGGFNN